MLRAAFENKLKQPSKRSMVIIAERQGDRRL